MNHLLFLLLASFKFHGVHSHGYVTLSRAKKCVDGVNQNCGLIIYEPQSLEGPQGFPSSGPPNGRIASADGEAPSQTQGLFLELYEQSSGRWAKTNVQAGSIDLSWVFTANHVTRDWRYYLTKEGWNPNLPLSRSSFDLNPFCTVAGNMVKPPFTLSHTCDLPSRNSGYHIILAVWDVVDTPMAFYNVIDVQFGGNTPSNPPPAPAPKKKTPPAPAPPAPAPPAPAPPAPAPPAPAPQPENSDANGYCCFWPSDSSACGGQCSDASKAVGWCGESEGKCSQCSGHWCAGESSSETPPAPAPAPPAPAPPAPAPPAPAPPAPAPVTAPQPENSDANGYCCFWPNDSSACGGQCSDASKAVGWCGESQDRCSQCSGHWCAGESSSETPPAPAPAPPAPAPPAPVPAPQPESSDTGGYCCYWPNDSSACGGQCSEASKAVGWCAESQDRCSQCSGHWCDGGNTGGKRGNLRHQ